MADEVLAHISAPVTRQNDELFRSLANAYTTFEPFRIHRDEPVQKRAKIDQATGLDSVQGERSTTRGTANSSVLTASKESYGSFPSNLSSEDHHHDQEPASAIDDSVRPISRLAQLDRSYLSWRQRATPRTSLAHGKTEPRNSSSAPEDANTGFIEDSQLAVEILQSQLQDTYSTTSEDTSDDNEHQDEGIDSTEKWSSRRVSPSQSQQSEINEGLKLPAVSREEGLADMGETFLEEPTDLSIYMTRDFQSKSHTTMPQSCFSMLPVDAFPPAPAISVACPTTLPSQITRHLATIKTKNPDRFKPLNSRKSLDADERGYWLVECKRWPPNLQWEFWSLLYEHVQSGRIGWGVTLHRDAECDDTLGRVKLYCWGEIVEHVWLLLWLCSKGKISGSGSSWIDANGVAVLKVQ
ncbi:hypothetical protein EKO04_002367 [Ascochyta lentis]|uniref:Uncharacterized protein n=1 Tax=Ascochyta lentis TaxID=205686 RepID=A0A8H7J9M9_9PLEO|nr:hypothetical protein EKO04_002367 [Ascochyta lentis]